MLNLGYLLALEDAKASFTIANPKVDKDKDGLEAIYFELLFNHRSGSHPPARVKYPKPDDDKLTVVRERYAISASLLQELMPLSQAAISETVLKGELYAWAYSCLEQTFSVTMSQYDLMQAGSRYTLTYRLGAKQLESQYEIDSVSRWQELLVAAKCVREGYTICERRGETLQVVTPSGLIRGVDRLSSCNCTDFNSRFGQTRACQHVLLARAYIARRHLWNPTQSSSVETCNYLT